MSNSVQSQSVPDSDSPSDPEGNEPDHHQGSRPGPKTARGKAASSRNAIKLGLFSTYVPIERIDGEDAQERLTRLFNSLVECFSPTDPIAEFRVKRVAENLFRLERSDRGERAMIERSHLRAAQIEATSECQIDTDAAMSTSIAIRLVPRVRRLIDTLMALAEELETDARLSDESLKRLMSAFGNADPFAIECAVLCVTPSAPLSDAEEASGTSKTNANRALELIGAKRQQLEELEQRLQELDSLEQQTRLSGSCLPSQGDLDRLWRSRAAINKELEHDLEWLEARHQGSKKKATSHSEASHN